MRNLTRERVCAPPVGAQTASPRKARCVRRLASPHAAPRRKEIDWTREAKRQLKRQVELANIGYAELARRLTEMGVPTTEGSLGVRLSRGTFPAWFLFATLSALGVESLQLD